MRTSRQSATCHGRRALLLLGIAFSMIVVPLRSVRPAQDQKQGGASSVKPVKDPFPPPKPPTGPSSTETKTTPAAGGVYFSGTFSGSELGPDWKLVNPVTRRWKMQPEQKSLLIITQGGGLSDSKNLKDYLIMNKDLPSYDFEVIVEASIQIEGYGNAVSVALFEDDQNYFYVVFEGDQYNRSPYFGRVFQGKANYFNGESRGGPKATQPERIFLKIERQGNQYSGFYGFVSQPTAIDQVQWAKMGTLPMIDFHGKLVLCAYNYQDAPEVAAEFYSVVIRKRQAGGQTAPQ